MGKRMQGGVEEVPLCCFFDWYNKSYKKTQWLQFALPGLAEIRFDVFLVAFEGDSVAFSMVTLLHLWSHCFINATNIDGTS